MVPAMTTREALVQTLRSEHFAFVHGAEAKDWFDTDDFDALAASYERLGPDEYLKRTFMRRERRHGIFHAQVEDGRAEVLRAPDAPHYQSKDYNPLQGGIARHFEPIEGAIGEGRALQRAIAFGAELFAGVRDANVDWRVEVHQFRIAPNTGEEGHPTPEGRHRDGVDYVLVMMIDRVNLSEGTTTIHDAEGHELGAFTLGERFDLALVDDHHVWHGVTPVLRDDPSAPAHRDVLVVTYASPAKRPD